MKNINKLILLTGLIISSIFLSSCTKGDDFKAALNFGGFTYPSSAIDQITPSNLQFYDSNTIVSVDIKFENLNSAIPNKTINEVIAIIDVPDTLGIKNIYANISEDQASAGVLAESNASTVTDTSLNAYLFKIVKGKVTVPMFDFNIDGLTSNDTENIFTIFFEFNNSIEEEKTIAFINQIKYKDNSVEQTESIDIKIPIPNQYSINSVDGSLPTNTDLYTGDDVTLTLNMSKEVYMDAGAKVLLNIANVEKYCNVDPMYTTLDPYSQFSCTYSVDSADKATILDIEYSETNTLVNFYIDKDKSKPIKLDSIQSNLSESKIYSVNPFHVTNIYHLNGAPSGTFYPGDGIQNIILEFSEGLLANQIDDQQIIFNNGALCTNFRQNQMIGQYQLAQNEIACNYEEIQSGEQTAPDYLTAAIVENFKNLSNQDNRNYIVSNLDDNNQYIIDEGIHIESIISTDLPGKYYTNGEIHLVVKFTDNVKIEQGAKLWFNTYSVNGTNHCLLSPSANIETQCIYQVKELDKVPALNAIEQLDGVYYEGTSNPISPTIDQNLTATKTFIINPFHIKSVDGFPIGTDLTSTFYPGEEIPLKVTFSETTQDITSAAHILLNNVGFCTNITRAGSNAFDCKYKILESHQETSLANPLKVDQIGYFKSLNNEWVNNKVIYNIPTHKKYIISKSKNSFFYDVNGDGQMASSGEPAISNVNYTLYKSDGSFAHSGFSADGKFNNITGLANSTTYYFYAVQNSTNPPLNVQFSERDQDGTPHETSKAYLVTSTANGSISTNIPILSADLYISATNKIDYNDLFELISDDVYNQLNTVGDLNYDEKTDYSDLFEILGDRFYNKSWN